MLTFYYYLIQTILQYTTKKEEKDRFEQFLKFLSKVDERNEKELDAGGSAVHGVTIFSDMSSKEFKETLLGYKAAESKKVIKQALPSAIKKYDGSATSVDWTGVYTTSVKNQGYCGSCWAFSSVAQIESDSIRAGLLTTSDDLSVQQVVSW